MSMTIPVDALRFEAAQPVAVSPADGESSKRRIEGVAYSGDLLTQHWYWGAVIFDLTGIELAQERIPILVEHDRKQRAGHAMLEVTPSDLRIRDGVLLDNDIGQQVAQEADQGFPWQLSVHIEPIRNEDLKVGSTAVVNGRTITGPATIFRQSRIREVSLTPTGVDHNTHARVFSTGGLSMSERSELEALRAELDELKKKLDEAIARAEKAEGELQSVKASARNAKIDQVFARVGQKVSDEQRARYLSLPDDVFTSVLDDIERVARPVPPSVMFSAASFDGQEAAPQVKTLDASSIYSARKEVKQ